GVLAYQSSAASDLRIKDAAVVGETPAFSSVNLAAGLEWSDWTFEAFVTNLTDERGQVTRGVECSICTRVYAVPIQPRTMGVRLGSKF
ncbi:MAG: TonB-dependent receptor, partial [Asticcacaulis sp.]|nr:TonB-dependent receptor [Asticcacaulis sp.]